MSSGNDDNEWKKYGVGFLSYLMRQANMYHPDAPKCKCCGCITSGRWTTETVDEDRWTCIFQPWFEKKAKECGMEIAKGTEQNKCMFLNTFHPHKKDTRFWVIDLDVHLVSHADAHLINQEGFDWNCFTYGTKLFKATSVDDPEIQKLKKLLIELDRVDLEINRSHIFKL
jgi:hypothetical protein